LSVLLQKRLFFGVVYDIIIKQIGSFTTVYHEIHVGEDDITAHIDIDPVDIDGKSSEETSKELYYKIIRTITLGNEIFSDILSLEDNYYDIKISRHQLPVGLKNGALKKRIFIKALMRNNFKNVTNEYDSHDLFLAIDDNFIDEYNRCQETHFTEIKKADHNEIPMNIAIELLVKRVKDLLQFGHITVYKKRETVDGQEITFSIVKEKERIKNSKTYELFLYNEQGACINPTFQMKVTSENQEQAIQELLSNSRKYLATKPIIETRKSAKETQKSNVEIREKQPDQVIKKKKKEYVMSLEKHLETLREINGYKAAAIMDYTGEVLAIDDQNNVNLEETAVTFNDIFRKTHAATMEIGLDACNELETTTPKGTIVMLCSGVDGEHIHLIGILDKDGNHALLKRKLKKMIPDLLKEV